MKTASALPPPFPPRNLPAFARMPPAVFPPILGLLALDIALRAALRPLPDWQAVGDLFGGMAVGLWALAMISYGIKVVRRPSVIMDEIKTLPGRAGLATATMGGIASARLLLGPMPGVAQVVLFTALTLHIALGVTIARALILGPREAREITPAFLLNYVGFILCGPALVALGWRDLALILFVCASLAAICIMSVSLWQIIRRNPPAPLRPLLAIHVAALSLLASCAQALGFTGLALGILGLAAIAALALIVALPYITAAGFSPLWGAFTFPSAAFAVALFANGFDWTGRAVTVIAVVIIPVIAWKILVLWPTGVLATKTNAATA